MIEDTRADALPQLSAAALREWGDIVEHVLQGVAHSLNNRAAAISAVLDIARHPDDDPDAASAILGSEAERVQELVAVARALGAPDPRADAFTAEDAAAEAARILGLHAELRDTDVVFETASASPIRVQRWMFVRALVALAISVRRASPTRRVRVSLGVEDEWLAARAADSGGSGGSSPFMTELVAAMGGETVQGAFGFRVPTLATVRRREGR